MGLGRVGAGALVVGALVLSGAGAPAAPVASAELNHAAVVIDTGQGTVKKFCLAFPEESISGAEALRRVESDAVFASYGSKGQAVCSLCGVGCPAGNCFCDGSKFWAYHRAGPGGAPYQFSRAGVSSTEVRDGDVEGWRWGSGQAPPPATVGEVCDVPEPPARNASSDGGSAPPSSTTSPSPTTTAAPPGPAPADSPTPTTAPATPAGRATPPPTAPGPTVVPSATDGGSSGSADPPAPAAEEAVAAGEAAPPTTIEADGATGTAGEEASRPRRSTGATAARRDADGNDGGSLVGVIGFVAVLAGVVVWRSRLRRANVRS